MDRRLAGTLLIFASAAGFGSGALFAKGVYATGVDWMVLMAWRFLIGAGATWVWIGASRTRRRDVRRLSRRTVAVGLGLGILYVGNSATYYAGLEGVPASLAALIVYVYPAIVAVLSLRVGRRLEGRRAWTALGIALVGSALTIGGVEAGAVERPVYLLLVAVSPVIYSLWIVLQAWLSGERSGRIAHEAAGDDEGNAAAAVGGLVNTGAAAAYWILAVLTLRPVAPASIPNDAWPGILGIGFLSTFVAIVGFIAGSHLIGAARAALLSTVEPVWTVTLAAVLLGETLSPVQLAGGLLILLGVVIAQTSAERVPVPGEPLAERPLLRIADE